MYVKPEWKTFEVIENAGSGIHHAVNHYNPTRKPPRVEAKRISDEQLVIRYVSQRCPVVRGIVRGLGEFFGESFSIQETECMHSGHPYCTIFVKRLSQS